MCTVSNIMGIYQDQLTNPGLGWYSTSTIYYTQYATRSDIDALRKEIENLKTLMIQAIKHDKETGQADCQNEEKLAALQKIAGLVGIDLRECFKE